MWRDDGKALFCISADNMLIARRQCRPVVNGGRFLFNARAPDPRPRTINVLLNRPAALRR